MAEKKNWIKSAIRKPGALHKQMGVPAGKKIIPGNPAAGPPSPNGSGGLPM
jgi:hypothetical protein